MWTKIKNEIKKGKMINIDVIVKSIVPARKVIVGILAHVFVGVVDDLKSIVDDLVICV